MAPFTTLRENIAALEDEGLLRRVGEPVNKDTELMPLVRCQFRGLPEEQRTAWLFEETVDLRGNRYDIPVAVATVGASESVYQFNLGCDSNEELAETWDDALANPVEPREVATGPVKDVIRERGELEDGWGMDSLPIPISTPGFDPAPFLTSAFVITRHPDTDELNMGTYRCHVKSPTSFTVQFGESQDIYRHWRSASRRGDPLEAAIVLGAPPHVGAVSVANMPYEQSELEVSGGLLGEPLEVVACESVDLHVPTCGEFVIEGELSPDRHPEGPFGEFAGYMGQNTMMPLFDVSCITHREDPIYHAFISQFPPSESSKIRGISWEKNILRHIQSTNVEGVQDVSLHEASGSMFFLVIQIDKAHNSHPWQAINAALGYSQMIGKFTIVVDDDIDPHDMDSVVWALSTRVQPHRDVKTQRHRMTANEPSAAPPDNDKFERMYPGEEGCSMIMIDATRPSWGYPPTSLPKREYMERAIELWEQFGFDELDFAEPWYGYSLGDWSDEQEAAAEAAMRGEYFEYDRDWNIDRERWEEQ